MDALLAGEFQRLGGELRENTRWSPVGVQASAGPGTVKRELQPEGVVRASGRRAQPTENGWRWFGLKIHARNVDLAADLEMHVSTAGYAGINRINDGEVNVCGLFRASRGDTRPVDSRFDLLRGKPGTILHERLESARFDESSFCSVAGLSLKPQRAAKKAECSLGDALTMIPPVTGNGMSMALESAEIAMEPLARYSRGERDWAETQWAVARACDAAFARRLAWARLLQWLMFSPIIRTRLGAVLLRSEFVWRVMFTRTR